MRANWQNELISWADDMIGEPFEWGETDCASIVIKVVSTAYDDPKIDVKAPETLSEAVERFDKGQTPSKWLKSLGASLTENMKLCQRGDIVIIPDDEFDLQAAGVCLGFGDFMVSNSEMGVIRIARSDLPESAYFYRLEESIDDAG